MFVRYYCPFSTSNSFDQEALPDCSLSTHMKIHLGYLASPKRQFRARHNHQLISLLSPRCIAHTQSVSYSPTNLPSLRRPLVPITFFFLLLSRSPLLILTPRLPRPHRRVAAAVRRRRLRRRCTRVMYIDDQRRCDILFPVSSPVLNTTQKDLIDSLCSS